MSSGNPSSHDDGIEDPGRDDNRSKVSFEFAFSDSSRSSCRQDVLDAHQSNRKSKGAVVPESVGTVGTMIYYSCCRNSALLRFSARSFEQRVPQVFVM